ncbi:porin [Halobacteriovorax sp. GB3]|uniref:porin n=1 Tax=Halobacteriovorax sp. GB3 TaxID=2719615 RepID=UPI002362D182|nr:porin [Halobacteriovorax sp. GB3]MDD0852673.1 porin [Halobacteriovorax sp. GB3]
MKKLVISSALALVAAPAMADMHAKMPTFYGKLNKSVAYIDQDATTHKSFSGVRDVANSESRLGAKGNVDFDSLKFTYALELGINSTQQSSDSGRIRIRQSHIGTETAFGTLVFGQTYTPSANIAVSIDPFVSTIFGVANADQKALVSGAAGSGLGMEYRSRKDLLMYKTPKFMGLQYIVSTDKNDKPSIDSTPSNTEYGKETLEHLLTFNHKMGDNALLVFASMIKNNDVDTKDDETMMYGLKFDLGKMMSLTATMGSSESTAAGTTTKTEEDRMMVAAKYNMNAHSFMAKYSTYEKKEDRDITQIALGYNYAYNKHVSMRASVGQYNVDYKAASTTDNDSTIVAFGTQLKF